MGPADPIDLDRQISVLDFDVYVGDASAKIYWFTGPVEEIDPPIGGREYPSVSRVRVLAWLGDPEGGYTVVADRLRQGRDSLELDGLPNDVLHCFRVETFGVGGDRMGVSTPRVAMPGAVPTTTMLIPGESRELDSFSWSPQSDRLAFVQTAWTYSENPEEREYFPANVLIMDLATREARPLTTYVGEDRADYALFSVSWSPDGSRLAYVHSASRQASELGYRIWTTPVDRFDPTPATSGPLDHDPVWLESGAVAFARKSETDQRGYDDLFSAELGDGAVTPLTRDATLRGKRGLSVNPIDGAIVFAGTPSYGGDYQAALYTIKGSGSPRRLIPSSTWTDYEPSWTWDGRTVVFTSDRSGHPEIWAVDVATREVRQVTRGLVRGTRHGHAQVSPDGQSIAYLERSYRLPLDSIVLASY